MSQEILNCAHCGGVVEWLPVNGFEFNTPYCCQECEMDAFEQGDGYQCTACKLRAGEDCPHLSERLNGGWRRKCDEVSLDETAGTYAKRNASPEHFQAYLRDLETARGHASDCAVHNEPAYPNGPCDCGRSLAS